MNNDRSVSPSARTRVRRSTLVDGERRNSRTSPRRPSRAPPLDPTLVMHKQLTTAATTTTPTAATPTTTTSRSLTHSPSTFTELLEKNKLLVSPTERTERKIQKRHSLSNTTIAEIAENGTESTVKTARKAVKRRGSTGVLGVAAAAASRPSTTPKRRSSSRRKSKALTSPKPTLDDSDSLQVDSTQPAVPTKELPRKKSHSSQDDDDDDDDNERSSPKKPSSRRRIKALTSPKPPLGDYDSLQVDSTQSTAPTKELPRKKSHSSQDDDDRDTIERASPKKISPRRKSKALMTSPKPPLGGSDSLLEDTIPPAVPAKESPRKKSHSSKDDDDDDMLSSKKSSHRRKSKALMTSPRPPLANSDSLRVDSTQTTAPKKELPRKESHSSQDDDEDDDDDKLSSKKSSHRRKSKALTSLKPPLSGSDSLLEDAVPPSVAAKELPRKKSHSSQDDDDDDMLSPKKSSHRRKSMTFTSPKPPRARSNSLLEDASPPTVPPKPLPRKKSSSLQDDNNDDNKLSSKTSSHRRKSMSLTSPKPQKGRSNSLLEVSSPSNVPVKQVPRKKSSSLQDDNDDEEDLLSSKKSSHRRKSKPMVSPGPPLGGSNSLLEVASPSTVPMKQLPGTNPSSLQDDDDNSNTSSRKSSDRRKSKTMPLSSPPLGGSESLLEDSIQPNLTTTQLPRNNSSSLPDDDDCHSQEKAETQQQRVTSDTSSHEALQSPKLSATLSSNGSASPDQDETVDVATPKRIRRTKAVMKSRTSTASLPSSPFQQNRRTVSSVRKSLNLTAHEPTRIKPSRMRPLKGGRDDDDPEQDNARKAARDKLASVSWRIKRDSDHGLQGTTLLKRMASPSLNKASSSRLAKLRSEQHQQDQPKSQGEKERKDDNSASKKQRRKRTREVIRSQLEGISDRLSTSTSHVGPLMAMRDALLTQATTDETVGIVNDHESEHHPSFREIFEMFEAGLHNRTDPAYVPFPSGKKTNEAVAKNKSRVTSASLKEAMRPQVDLAGLLRHVMFLNEFKDLTSPTFASANTTLDPSLSMSSASSSSSSKARLSLFHRMFQLKCVLLSIMGDDETSEDILPKLQALHDQFELDPSDLKFVLEHIALCLQHQKLQQQQQQQQQQNIRWDLIQSMFFPEDDGSSLQGSFRIGDGSRTSTDSADLHEEEEGYEEELSTREALQEVILQLYETYEESMEEWSEAERELRRKVLVELLQATSDEECHQSAVCLEDLQEIARHVRICHDTGASVEWDLISALVFPLGIADEPSSGLGSSITAFSPFDDSPDDHPVELSSPSRVQASLSPVLDNSTRSRTVHHHNGVGGGDFLNRHDELQLRFGLNKEEVDQILSHIQGCTLAADIRWDLIGNVCFPNDTDRCKLLTSLETTSTVL